MGGIQASVSIHAGDVKSRHGAGVRETETHIYPFKLAGKYHGSRYLADPIQGRNAERIKRNIPNYCADERQAEKTTPGHIPPYRLSAATKILSQSYHSNDPELTGCLSVTPKVVAFHRLLVVIIANARNTGVQVQKRKPGRRPRPQPNAWIDAAGPDAGGIGMSAATAYGWSTRTLQSLEIFIGAS
jgi:hypothetical protein